jgi:branched-chain amino acid transport system substrate-binding protein
MIKSRAALAAFGVVGLLAAGCGGSSGDDDKSSTATGGSESGIYADTTNVGVTDDAVKLGVIADLTGPTAANQAPYVNGIKAYIEQTNDAGGVEGRTIELETCDEKYTAEAGLACLARFTKQDPVFALAGSLNAATVQVAGRPIVDRAKIPVVGPQSVQAEVIQAKSPYIFYTQCDYADQADVAGAYMQQELDGEKPRVATIVYPVPSGEEWKGQVRRVVEAAGGEMVGDFTIQPTATDADAVVQRMLSKKPNYFAVQAGAPSMIAILKSLAKFGADDLKGVGIFGTASDAIYKGSPPETGRNWAAVHCYTHPSVGADGLAEMEEAAEKHGFSSDVEDVNFVHGWVTGRVIVEGLKAAGADLTRGSFLKGLETIKDLDTQGLSGPISFGPDVRSGAKQLRPYVYDYDAGKIEAVGEYADWADAVTNQYTGDQQ